MKIISKICQKSFSDFCIREKGMSQDIHTALQLKDALYIQYIISSKTHSNPVIQIGVISSIL